MHKLLLRQLQQHCENAGLEYSQQPLLQAISNTYEEHELDRKALDESLFLTSKELNERTQLLRTQLQTLSQIQDQLQKSLTALNATFDATGEIILSLDNLGRLVKSNKMGKELLPEIAKYEGRQQAISWQNVHKMLLNPWHLTEIVDSLQKQPKINLKGTLHFTNGRIFEYHSLPQLQNNLLIGRVWCLRDVTEEKKIEEFIHHQAYHDLLTGLPNRHFLLEKIDAIIKDNPEKDKKLAVIFIDLDNFKKVNDTDGHEAGDKLLRIATKRMRNCVRDGDILARLGGDEFLILIESPISQSGLTRMCSNILDTLKKPFLLNNHNHFISCSMGISIYPRDDTVPDGLIGKADMAMYRAKKLGKNNFQFYSEELERLALHQLEFENNLRVAINKQQISIQLQPEINITTGKIVAAEALARWTMADGTVIPPTQFIPVAEQANLIGEIGRLVFDKVCKEISRWKRHGINDITVAINLSAREFKDSELVNNIHRKMLEHAIDGEKIVLEITESLFMEDKESVLRTMNQLRDIGIRFAIDDFGTGYSSFSYLQDLPIDYLKIDRSFLIGVTENKKKYAIARSIIDIGNHLDLKVIAEGIEDQETLDFIISNQCAMAQGFFMHNPLSTDDFFALLIKDRATK
ncbi:MAG: EAL domain-containing protein [Gammaproteobacteria bacterium]|nr:MAG: EAL domain-containing protein [Gammaproteobacteria bacterium]